jgi:hypothetical protein
MPRHGDRQPLLLGKRLEQACDVRPVQMVGEGKLDGLR